MGIVISTPNREREWEEKEGMGFGRVEGFLIFFSPKMKEWSIVDRGENSEEEVAEPRTTQRRA